MTIVFCRRTEKNHDFYVRTDGNDFYLFSQKRRKSVGEFYEKGVILDKAINHGIGRPDWAIHHTMDKLVPYIRYIESEYKISILKKTKNRKAA